MLKSEKNINSINSVLSLVFTLFNKFFLVQTVGAVRGQTHNGVTEIGLVAVHPDNQGRGVGKQLLNTIESRGKGGKCTIGIVSCRTDVIPFFEHMGYTVCNE